MCSFSGCATVGSSSSSSGTRSSPDPVKDLCSPSASPSPSAHLTAEDHTSEMILDAETQTPLAPSAGCGGGGPLGLGRERGVGLGRDCEES